MDKKIYALVKSKDITVRRCPACGNPNILVETDVQGARVRCMDCGTKTDNFDNIDKALRMWNEGEYIFPFCHKVKNINKSVEVIQTGEDRFTCPFCYENFSSKKAAEKCAKKHTIPIVLRDEF